jgi:hypothetical protein
MEIATKLQSRVGQHEADSASIFKIYWCARLTAIEEEFDNIYSSEWWSDMTPCVVRDAHTKRNAQVE